ncbi:DUF1456 domain-containing protein [Nonlabens sp. MB-3u-79]|jgi:uncharacterized protein YehS (DUF1456 family)|uniref:DUF1456 family protein n=1 Tax=Nonlabens sp. MB-3u-79 TaxID=2058134 RepID=UPI000C30E782|nr:DUF1456 family protein [Nonlabens sp. MB-3u-79]AUC79862.1 DUF1456 domain-containing protein [Nonlabens sp. MB-3u-79]|tara:strand:+ start:30511 stop:31008 length:498 start_codon:yes stop_codon:yes gene_type:complete
MDNNDILRRLRFTLNLSDDSMMDMYAKGGERVSRAEISSWLKKEEDEDFDVVVDENLATFLNGLIVNYRGKKEGQIPVVETELDNTIILRKLKIAFNFTSDELIYIWKKADVEISETELSAFFRKKSHPKFKYLNDQYLRKFLKGFQIQRKTQREKEAYRNSFKK